MFEDLRVVVRSHQTLENTPLVIHFSSFNTSCEQSTMSGTGQQHSRIDPSSTSGGTAANNNVIQRQPSENFKKAQKKVKTAITRASSAGVKAVAEAQPFIDDTSVVHDAIELKTINDLRKKLIVIKAMIETDNHFHDFVSKVQEVLSNKERHRLREAAKAHLNLKPRTNTLPVLRTTILALQEALEKQKYRYDEEVSSTEAADISELVETSPQEDEIVSDEDDLNDPSLSDTSQEVIDPLDAKNEDSNRVQHTSFDGITNSGGTQVPPVVTSDIRSNTETHKASSSAPQGSACPLCRGSHDLLDCTSPKLPVFCAKNDLCVLCTSSRHKTHQCPLREPRSSPIFASAMRPESGGRFVTSATPIVASTPRQVQSNFPNLSDSEGKEQDVSARSPAPQIRTEVSSDEEADDECREAQRGRKMKSSNKGLSYYDLESILPKFSGDALRYKKFISMFEKLGMQNPRLSDEMRLAILEKKLVGDAKRFYVDLGDPRKAIEASLEGLRSTFEGDTSGVTEALTRFRELTFHETDLKRSSRQLQDAKTLVLRLRDLGEDVDSPAFVRNLMEKLPEKMIRVIKPLFDNGGQPSTNQIFNRYASYLNDRAFVDRFRTAKVSERLKEIPGESVMATNAILSTSKNPRGNSTPGGSTRTAPKFASSPKPANVSNNASPTSGKGGKGQNPSKNSNQPNKSGNQGSSGQAGLGYFGSQATAQHQGNQASLSQGSAPFGRSSFPNPQGIGSPGNRQGGGPTSNPNSGTLKPRIPGMKGQPGEKLEPCYKYGRGYDERFIAHTFPRDSEVASKCCFICGPGHSILQCALPSYEVRQFFRSSGSCHNCAQRTHPTEECKSFSTCAYCQGKHNSGACTLKEYYRDPRNYPSDAPAPILSEFFRGPLGGSHVPTVASPATAPLVVIGTFKRSSTGEIRSATVRCTGKIYERPENQLTPLELSSSDDDPALEPVQGTHDSQDPPDPPRTATFPILYQMSFHTDGTPFSMAFASSPRLPKTKFVCPRLSAADIRYSRDNQIAPRRLLTDSSFNGQVIGMLLGIDLLPRLLGTSRRLLLPYEIFVKLVSGIIEMVTPEMDNTTDPVYYIPHRVVVKESSLMTKLRIVFDASSKKGRELSLNDCLDPGPSMLVDLYDILIRSRLPDFLVEADIQKAFHQVRLDTENRNCTRFILKDNAKPPVRDNLIEYRFTRIPFGMTCSPFHLAATIVHFPNGMTDPIAERIRKNIYVNNIMITSNDRAQTQNIRSDSSNAFTSMNKRPREYISNSAEEMSKFPREEITADPSVNLLGYHWNSVDHRNLAEKSVVSTAKSVDTVEKSTKPNTLKTSVEGKRLAKVKVQSFSESLVRADSKVPDLDIGRSGTSIGGMKIPFAPDSDACRSDASGDGAKREVPNLEASRSGASNTKNGLKSSGPGKIFDSGSPRTANSLAFDGTPRPDTPRPVESATDLDVGRSGTSIGGMKIPFAPDSDACRSDASGDGAKREVPNLEASRSGASNTKNGLKSSGPGKIFDSGSPRTANSLAFDGTPRPDTPRPVESATDLDVGRSGTSIGGMKIPFAPDSDACRSDASGDGAKREVPNLEASRSGASNTKNGLKSSGPGKIFDSGSPRTANSLAFDGTPRPDTPRPVESATDLDVGRSGTSIGGMKIPFAPDSDACRSDASGDGAKREVPNLEASRSGASNMRYGLKSSGPGKIFVRDSPRAANSLAFDGTPRPDTPRPATDLVACRSGAPRKRRRLQSPDSGSIMDVGRSGTSIRRILPSAPDSDVCRSGTSGDGAQRKVPNLEAGRSGASKAGKSPRTPDSDASRSGSSGNGYMRVVPNLDANRHASVNDSAKLDSDSNAPRQRNTEIMDDLTQSSGSAISHGDIVPQDTANHSPGVSYPMMSSRPDSVDHAKTRLPAHRVRPYQPRKAKAKLARYIHITQAAGPQTPRSVDSLLVPESGSCPTPN
ncbi:hypothetical protein CRE_26633 [Caenorhabditis remanei]|uniref:Reverse transcriptase domain-containing protein n=1 Tax=Caenorhabditis remanei TaxID=31234 RepID=E3MKY8_CAERE|nr:hypothetical protein CRE_26633 [Caenorhabditis remanei]